MGEGWHNNHHAYQASARQGFRWWEIDLTYYVLKLLEALGVVWDLKTPPEAVLRNERPLGARVVRRTAEQLAACFNPGATAREIQRHVPPAELARLAEMLTQARQQAMDLFESLPQLPSRHDFVQQARSLFAHTPSLDQIVDHAHDVFLRQVGEHLASLRKQPLPA